MLSQPPDRERVTLDLKLGRWLEARATGWAVLAVPLIVGLALVALALGFRLR